MRILRPVPSSVAFSNIRRNRYRRAPDLTRETVDFLAGKAARDSIRLERERDALLPNNELAMIGNGHWVSWAGSSIRRAVDCYGGMTGGEAHNRNNLHGIIPLRVDPSPPRGPHRVSSVWRVRGRVVPIDRPRIIG